MTDQHKPECGVWNGVPQGDRPDLTKDCTCAPQSADTPGQDENQDGLTGGQTTADNLGDVLGI